MTQDPMDLAQTGLSVVEKYGILGLMGVMVIGGLGLATVVILGLKKYFMGREAESREITAAVIAIEKHTEQLVSVHTETRQTVQATAAMVGEWKNPQWLRDELQHIKETLARIEGKVVRG